MTTIDQYLYDIETELQLYFSKHAENFAKEKSLREAQQLSFDRLRRLETVIATSAAEMIAFQNEHRSLQENIRVYDDRLDEIRMDMLRELRMKAYYRRRLANLKDDVRSSAPWLWRRLIELDDALSSLGRNDEYDSDETEYMERRSSKTRRIY
jgi:hypothetical protein